MTNREPLFLYKILSMKLSFWEQQSWLSNVDYTIIGSGIVGLTCALHLRKKYPDSKILILEKGILPNGASTKNAGFACFGSISEIIADLKTHTKAEVLDLVRQRYEGLLELRELVDDRKMSYQNLGGYELFTQESTALYEHCVEALPEINALLHPIFKTDVYQVQNNPFQFEKIQPQVIFNKLEGQIHTGAMMQSLLRKVYENGILILNSIEVQSFQEQENRVEIFTDQFQFHSKNVILATNGFSAQLGIAVVKPARAQVLITEPIDNLKIKGTFHLDEGYYYFRNIDNRILLGGGRNLDFKTEETTIMTETSLIQNRLDQLLKEVILPDTEVRVAQRWSGIMGVGVQKKPIVKKLSERIALGVRLGGMGIAIGSSVGKKLSKII